MMNRTNDDHDEPVGECREAMRSRQEFPMTSEEKDSSMSTLKIVGLFLCAYFLSYLCDHAFLAIMPSSGIDPYYIAGASWTLSMVFVGALVFIWKPDVARHLSFKTSILSAFIAMVLGLLIANAAVAIQSAVGKVAFPPRDMLTIALVIIAGPIVEEIFFRGIILESLLRRNASISSVLISAMLIAFAHESFWPALFGQVMLSSLYLLFRRSLLISIIAHIFSNLFASFPSVFLFSHYVGYGTH